VRYFKTTNALRPYKIEGRSFEFERLRLIGGLFHGVLALEESEWAEKVAAYGNPISEITQDDYYSLKKKAPPNSQSFSNLEAQPKVPPKRVKDAASAVSPKPEAESPEEPETPEELFKTGDVEIPDHLDQDLNAG
jgi:hypothetical protein